mmetsp:Transcript_31457/g.79447  ORF Transcript_31457/g.79447 Transcript_31457/m.79447 type:complete len:218 (-) Transcript_31457:77-730(-)
MQRCRGSGQAAGEGGRWRWAKGTLTACSGGNGAEFELHPGEGLRKGLQQRGRWQAWCLIGSLCCRSSCSDGRCGRVRLGSCRLWLPRHAAWNIESDQLRCPHVVELHNHILATDGNACDFAKSLKTREGRWQLCKHRGRDADRAEVVHCWREHLSAPLQFADYLFRTPNVEECNEQAAGCGAQCHVNACDVAKSREHGDCFLERNRELLLTELHADR